MWKVKYQIGYKEYNKPDEDFLNLETWVDENSTTTEILNELDAVIECSFSNYEYAYVTKWEIE